MGFVALLSGAHSVQANYIQYYNRDALPKHIFVRLPPAATNPRMRLTSADYYAKLDLTSRRPSSLERCRKTNHLEICTILKHYLSANIPSEYALRTAKRGKPLQDSHTATHSCY